VVGMASQESAWLSFEMEADLAAGVDLRALSQFLADLASAARLIADERLGISPRRGRMVREERAVAALRLTGITDGSVKIDLARPSEGEVFQLAFDESTAADAVASELIDGLEAVVSGTFDVRGSHSRHQVLQKLVRSTARIAPEATIFHRAPGREVRVTRLLIDPSIGFALPAPTEIVIVDRVMFGQVQMADVEDGRQRLRAKLPSGADATISVSDEAAASLPQVLGRLAELHVREALQGNEVIERTVEHFRVLEPDEEGPTIPPKSLEVLAREQGILLREPPDYPSLLEGVFTSGEDVESFGAYLRGGPLIA